eukprot:5376335-Pyramimonas_sp.AAC.1
MDLLRGILAIIFWGIFKVELYNETHGIDATNCWCRISVRNARDIHRHVYGHHADDFDAHDFDQQPRPQPLQ